jgi:hypothetical protein
VTRRTLLEGGAMHQNQNTIVDYAAVADERATRDGRAGEGQSARSYAALALLLIGIVVALLIITVIVQSGGTPS